mgnify:CR=1 FL=1
MRVNANFFAHRHYINRRSLGGDVAAGATLGVQSIPAAMAAGVLAGVNPIFAVHAVMLSTPIGALFASSVFLCVQTTAAMSLLIADVPQVHGGSDSAGALFMLAIMTGVLMLAAGLLKLGRHLRFIPNAVLTGFINGVAILIVLGQIGDLTGTSPGGANKVVQAFNLVKDWRAIDVRSLAVGLVAIILIVVLHNTRLKSWGMVVALIVASLLVPLFEWQTVALVSDIAVIPDTLPLPVLPALSVLPALVIPAVSLAFVGLVQGAGISQSYTNPDGKYPSASGDFIGQGAANIAAGIFQGMPVGGSLSATALVRNAGAASRLANIVAGGVIALSLVLLGNLVGSMAMPSLAGLLIVVGLQTLKPAQIMLVLRTGRIQAMTLLGTLVVTLLVPLQYAVMIGIAIAVLLYLVKQSNRMTLKEWVLHEGQVLPTEQEPPPELPSRRATIITPYGSTFYATARLFEQQLPAITAETHRAVLVLNVRHYEELGSTFLGMLERYASELRKHDSKLMLAEVSPRLYNQLHKTGRLQKLKPRNVYRQSETVGASILEAHDDALEWVALDDAGDGDVLEDQGR